MLVYGVTEQLATKYSRTKFIEFSAGTGGATNAILECIRPAVGSYDYTDISSAFFEHSANHSQLHTHNMVHWKRSGETRKLLKPGGCLVVIEIIRNYVKRHGLVVVENNEIYHGPSLAFELWNKILKEPDYESSSPMPDPTKQIARSANSLDAKLNTSNTSSVVLGGKCHSVQFLKETKVCDLLSSDFSDIAHVNDLRILLILHDRICIFIPTELEDDLF
ncbi:Fusarin C synthetase [Colletotrichum gloeosporioides]|uniref:Fusarin C synthetase n=1 Tax=Colletotrichum gloeosporioides TaxID=474922 RepID=A0A8H4CL89_COLGL|nr:Fusarin C synthetase [Colletotrichum gloeosporioides]KAF3805837.1 Fusarin C synthetase [Colletotrichum gloeosporioides]